MLDVAVTLLVLDGVVNQVTVYFINHWNEAVTADGLNPSKLCVTK